jgi:hypothetical protein
LDSFFAFGLFRLGERAEVFPRPFISIFETIMQEEARHILFIVNWAAYLRAQRPLLLRPGFDVWRGWNIAAQAFDRLTGAMRMAGGDGKKPDPKSIAPDQDKAQTGFTLKAHSIFGDFSLRSFLETCLEENDRRLAPYDPRLLRPTLVPSVIRQVVKVLPRRAPSRPPSPEEKAA